MHDTPWPRRVVGAALACLLLASCSGDDPTASKRDSDSVDEISTFATERDETTATSRGPRTRRSTTERAQPPDESQSLETSLFDAVIIHESDLPPGFTIDLIPGGDEVEGQVSLDLCNQEFAIDELRVARRQVSVRGQDTGFGVEAILYRETGDAEQAMLDLREAQRTCPDREVDSKVRGRPAARFSFGPPPDDAWPNEDNVQRLAFDVTLTEHVREPVHTIGTYLQRGRLVVGIYALADDDPERPTDDRTSPRSIVTLTASRIAALPNEAVN